MSENSDMSENDENSQSHDDFNNKEKILAEIDGSFANSYVLIKVINKNRFSTIVKFGFYNINSDERKKILRSYKKAIKYEPFDYVDLFIT